MPDFRPKSQFYILVLERTLYNLLYSYPLVCFQLGWSHTHGREVSPNFIYPCLTTFDLCLSIQNLTLHIYPVLGMAPRMRYLWENKKWWYLAIIHASSSTGLPRKVREGKEHLERTPRVYYCPKKKDPASIVGLYLVIPEFLESAHPRKWHVRELLKLILALYTQIILLIQPLGSSRCHLYLIH